MARSPRLELFALRRRSATERAADRGFQHLAVALAGAVGLLVFAILLTVFSGAWEAIQTFGLSFITTSDWDPISEHYGAFTAIYGTLVSSGVALLIAVPLGVGTAIFLTENIIPKGIREVLGVMVELLAAIPSVVLGLWAIVVMEPFLRPFLTDLHRYLGWIPLFSTDPGPGHGACLADFGGDDPSDHHGYIPGCPQAGPRRAQAGGLWDRDHALGRHLSGHASGGHLRHHRWRDVGVGTGDGRNHGRHHDHRQLQQLQLQPLGPGQHHLLDVGQPIW